jgi:hypothetical protein
LQRSGLDSPSVVCRQQSCEDSDQGASLLSFFSLDSCNAAASILLLWSVVSKVASAPINAPVCRHFLVLILATQRPAFIFRESVFFLHIVQDSFINFSFNQRVFLVFLRS